MSIAKKYEIEGPIGLQLNKQQYSKMLNQVDVVMQRELSSKKKKLKNKKPFSKAI